MAWKGRKEGVIIFARRGAKSRDQSARGLFEGPRVVTRMRKRLLVGEENGEVRAVEE